MPVRRSGLVVLGLSAAVVLAAAVASPRPAAAQGLFESLFGSFDDHFRRPRRSHAPAYAPERDDDRYPRRELSPRPQQPPRQAAGTSGGSVHCVRLCDGRYFPAPKSANGARLDAARVCSALCPKAKTRVFNGSHMEHAVAADGTRYASLDTAFAFRDRIVPDCSCTGHGPGGLAQIDVNSDPTLRVGDVVVTASGPAVFNGAKEFPYKTADFTPIDDYAKLNARIRARLSELQVNTRVKPALPPQELTGAAIRPAKPERARRAQTKERRHRAAERREARRRGFWSWW